MNWLRRSERRTAANLENVTMNMKARTNGSNGNGKAPRPIHRVKRGAVEAAIWERYGRQGRFLQVSFERPYTTKDGSIGSSPNFTAGNIADIVTAAVEAMLFMEAQRKPRTRNGDYSAEGTEAEFDQDATDYDHF
jgi:hypothetical protein